MTWPERATEIADLVPTQGFEDRLAALFVEIACTQAREELHASLKDVARVAALSSGLGLASVQVQLDAIIASISAPPWWKCPVCEVRKRLGISV